MTNENPVYYTLGASKVGSSDAANDELKILRALAAGNHPITGVPLPDDSCYQSAKVLRALLAAIQALEKKVERKDCLKAQELHGPRRNQKNSKGTLTKARVFPILQQNMEEP